jgi:predicted Zn-dependent protease
LGQKEEAISYLRQACTEGDEESWLELASAYVLLGQPGNAREAAAQTLRHNPGHPWAQVVIGHCLILEGRRAQGLEVLKRAVMAGPRRPRVWHDLARAFAAAGDAGKAAECDRRAAAIIQG